MAVLQVTLLVQVVLMVHVLWGRDHMSVRDQMIDQNEIVLDDLKTMMR
jgi:hypothetical protein